MRDPFRLPRRFLRNEMANRRFASRNGALRIWCGLLMKPDERSAHYGVEQDAFSAMWILRGETVYSDAAGERRCGPGALICRLPGRRHSTVPVAGSGLVEFFLDLDVAWYRRLVGLGAAPAQACAELGWDAALADRCLSYLVNLGRLPETAWPSALAEAQAILAAFVVGCQGRPGQPDPAIAHACALLADDLPGRLTVAAVAQRVGLGFESFRKRFTAATGASPNAWRISRRIDAACARLLVGDRSVAEVARDLGYADVPTFSKQFRRVTGLPPAAWRRAQCRSGA